MMCEIMDGMAFWMIAWKSEVVWVFKSDVVG